MLVTNLSPTITKRVLRLTSAHYSFHIKIYKPKDVIGVVCIHYYYVKTFDFATDNYIIMYAYLSCSYYQSYYRIHEVLQ